MKSCSTLLFILFMCFIHNLNAQPGTIITVAGGNNWGSYAGDGLHATDTAVRMNKTAGLCKDFSGNLYISDVGNARVRRVDAVTGVITTIAGNGTSGFSGDGGLATSAKINGVTYNMCLNADVYGNIYLADNGNNRIRKINATTGIITTVAGGGSSNANGVPATSAAVDAVYMYVDASANIYFVQGNKIRKVDATSGLINTIAGSDIAGYAGDNGPATNAKFDFPRGITGDAIGNLYICDQNNHRIRKINTSGIITTIDSTAIQPRGIAIDAGNNIYFGDGTTYQYLQRIDAITGNVTTVAGGGTSGSPNSYLTSPISAISLGPKLDHIIVDPNGSSIYYSTYQGWVEKITQSPIACAGIPTAGIITSNVNMNNCTVALQVSGVSPGVNLQWQKSTDNMNWNSIAGATNYVYSPNNSAPTCYYRCTAYCPISGSAGYSASVHHASVAALNQVTFNSPDSSCGSPDFFVYTCNPTSSYSVKSFFGDGINNTTTLTSGNGYSYAHISHAYNNSGTYTVKQVLYNGANAIDSGTFSYQYIYCRTLSAKFYNDNNINCVFDNGDVINYYAVSIEVDSNSVPIDTISATGGYYYKAKGGPGTIYTFKTLSVAGNRIIACPSTGIWKDTIQSGTNTYPTKFIGIHCTSSSFIDFSVSGTIMYSPLSGTHDFLVAGPTCNLTAPTLTFQLSPKYYFPSSYTTGYDPATSITNNTATWVFSSALNAAMAPTYIHRTFNHQGATLTIGDTVHTITQINPITGDVNPNNNVMIRCDTVKASYDPNEMAVMPSNCFVSDTLLQYLIRFENDGNDIASNIYVMDTLSDNLDPATFRVFTSSHPMDVTKYTYAGHTILKFDFPNINLPDSTHHETCSGMLIYYIRNRAGLMNGSAIKGRAGIYFDDNAVVMTPDAIVHKGDCGETLNIGQGTVERTLAVYPNPATVLLHINNVNTVTSYRISNMMGSTMKEGSLEAGDNTLSIAELPTGVYQIQLTDIDGQRVSIRVVKQ